jgi:hypothetical protein
MKSQRAQMIASLEAERAVIDQLIRKLKALAPPAPVVRKPRLVAEGA